MKNYSSISSKIFISHYDCERPIDWDKKFSNNKPVHVEIGFGYGEFLVQCVKENPGINYVGVEIDWKRIRKCFKNIASFSDEKKEEFYQRLRILQVDAWVAFERLFCPKTVDYIECLFPCPWPKDRHEKHRLFSKEFLCLLNSRLKDGGVFHFVTDHWPYADWILERVDNTGFKVSKQTISPQFKTKFEHKWTSGGQQEFCELVFKKEKHIDIAVKEDINLKAYYHQDFDPGKFCLSEDASSGIVVVPKEWVYDPEQQKGMARVVVSEEHLTQHLWIGVVKAQKGWCVLRAEGQHVLSTPGVAHAIKLVSSAVEQTVISNQ